MTAAYKLESNDITEDRIIVENFFGRQLTLWGLMEQKWTWGRETHNVWCTLGIAVTNFHVKYHPLRNCAEGDDYNAYWQYHNRLHALGVAKCERKKQQQRIYRERQNLRKCLVDGADVAQQESDTEESVFSVGCVFPQIAGITITPTNSEEVHGSANGGSGGGGSGSGGNGGGGGRGSGGGCSGGSDHCGHGHGGRGHGGHSGGGGRSSGGGSGSCGGCCRRSSRGSRGHGGRGSGGNNNLRADPFGETATDDDTSDDGSIGDYSSDTVENDEDSDSLRSETSEESANSEKLFGAKDSSLIRGRKRRFFNA